MHHYTILKGMNIVRSLALVVIMLACQEDTVVENNRGDIVGFVSLVDENGLAIQDAKGVTVTLDDGLTATTDGNGRFEFKNIAAGTYHPTYEKDGFGTMKKFNYLFTAGNVPGVLDVTNMVELPSVKLLTKSVNVSGTALQVSGTLEPTESFYLIFNLYDKADAKPGEAIASSGVTYCCGTTQVFIGSVYMPDSPTLYLGIYAVSMANQNSQFYYYDYEQSVGVNAAMKELVAPFKVK